MKKNEFRNKKMLKYIPIILVVIYFIFSLNKLHNDSLIDGYFNSGIRGFVFLLEIVFLMTMLFFLYYKKEWKIQKKFLLISITMGTIFMLITPVWQVADEVVHCNRAYDLARGRIFYQRHDDSMELPKSMKELYDTIDKDRLRFHPEQKIDKDEFMQGLNISLDKEDTYKYYGNNTEAYLFLAYVPQAIGVFIGDLLNLPIYFVLLFGRLTNLAFWITICYLALKIMPIKKELMMFVMLLPMSIFQAASFSPDSVLNSCSFLLIAYILYLKYEKSEVQIKDVGIILLLTIVIVSVKMPYIAISLLILTVPKEKFKFKKNTLNMSKMILVLACILVINLSIFTIWNKISRPIDINNSQITEANSQSESLGTTIKTIVKNPIKFCKLSINTLNENSKEYVEGFIAKFGWLDTKVPNSFIAIMFYVLLLLALNGEKDKRMFLWDRFILISIGIGLYFVLCAVAVQWYGIGTYDVLPGIQGRYFYPFILCLLLPFYQSKFSLNLRKYSWLIPFISVYALTYSANVILVRYWIY